MSDMLESLPEAISPRALVGAARATRRDTLWLQTKAEAPSSNRKLSSLLATLKPATSAPLWWHYLLMSLYQICTESKKIGLICGPTFPTLSSRSIWQHFAGKKRAGCKTWSIKNCWGLAWSLSKTKLEVLHKSMPALCIPHTPFMLWNDRM